MNSEWSWGKRIDIMVCRTMHLTADTAGLNTSIRKTARNCSYVPVRILMGDNGLSKRTKFAAGISSTQGNNHTAMSGKRRTMLRDALLSPVDGQVCFKAEQLACARHHNAAENSRGSNR
jgi:hypothetical protein